jgi:hypothetical protein
MSRTGLVKNNYKGMKDKNNCDVRNKAKATVKSEGKTKPVMIKHKMQQKAPGHIRWDSRYCNQ